MKLMKVMERKKSIATDVLARAMGSKSFVCLQVIDDDAYETILFSNFYFID